MAGITYEAAGVSFGRKEVFLGMVQEEISKQWDGRKIGGFADGDSIPNGCRSFKAGVDGVGTKIYLAGLMDFLEVPGFDAVGAAAVDVFVSDRQPSSVLIYLKVDRLRPEKQIRIMKGVIDGCMKCGCNLIGGETAEHPGIGLPPGYFDLAAFCIGFEEHTSGYPVSMDMDVLGWSSYGLGTNGYSLVRDIYDIHSRSELEQYYVELKQTLGESLLKPLAIYIRNVKDLEWCIEFSAHAHITGGGLLENIPRILPDDCAVEIDLRTWERPPIFKLIQEKGNLADEEMFRVFNQGLQMVSIVSVSKYIRDNMPGYIQRIGRVIRRPSSGAQVIFKGSFQ